MPLAPNRVWTNQGLIPKLFPEKAKLLAGIKLPASVSYAKGTVLGEYVGVDAQQLIGSTAGAATFTLTMGGQTTSSLTGTATAAQVAAALNALVNAGDNAVQTITLNGTITGGTFTLGYKGEQTAPLSYLATAAQVQAALLALPNIGGSNLTVTGSAGGPYTITFSSFLGNKWIDLLGTSTVGLVGSTTMSVVAAAVNTGGGGGSGVAATGGPLGSASVTVTFQNNLGKQAITLMTASGAGSASVTFANVTTGSSGTPGTYGLCVSTNTDGSQTLRGLLQFDCCTDANGNITLGQTTGGNTPWGETLLTTSIYISGYFDPKDLVGLTDTLVAQAGRMVNGTIAQGGLFELQGA